MHVDEKKAIRMCNIAYRGFFFRIGAGLDLLDRNAVFAWPSPQPRVC
jgi:hypothetical protein